MKWRKAYFKFRLDSIKEEIKTHHNCQEYRRRKEDVVDKRGINFLDWASSFVLFGATAECYFRLALFQKHNPFFRNHCVTSIRMYFMKTVFHTKESIEFCDSKEKFNTWYNDYLLRKWCVPNNVGKEEFVQLFKDCNTLFIKKLSGYGGEGAGIVDLKRESAADLYDRLVNGEGKFLAEEYYDQKGFYRSVNPSSLNTLRISTLRVKDKIIPVASYFRAGGEGSIVDNLHSGGVRYIIDVRNGVIHEGNSYKDGHVRVHPSSGIELYGLKAPQWEKAVEFAKKMHSMAPEGANMIGWDICISDDEMALIEGNAAPGFPVDVDMRINTWKTVRKCLNDL